jgi:hypothetical protein
VSDGSALWSTAFGGPNRDFGSSVASGTSGEVVIVAKVDGAFDIQGATIDDLDFSNTTSIIKFDSSHMYQWSKTITVGNGSYARLDSLRLDTDGSMVLFGFFGGTIDLGNGQLHSENPLWDLLLSKISTTGTPVWHRQFSNQEPAPLLGSMTLDSLGEPIVAVAATGTIDFGIGSLASSGGADGFIAKFSQ